MTLKSSSLMFGLGNCIVCYHLASLTPRTHTLLSHFCMVILTFNKYITFTETSIVVYSIESDCVHSLPSLSSKLAHFALLNDLGRHGTRAIGQNWFRQRLSSNRLRHTVKPWRSSSYIADRALALAGTSESLPVCVSINLVSSCRRRSRLCRGYQ
jgi:hypothetical protein